MKKLTLLCAVAMCAQGAFAQGALDSLKAMAGDKAVASVQAAAPQAKAVLVSAQSGPGGIILPPPNGVELKLSSDKLKALTSAANALYRGGDDREHDLTGQTSFVRERDDEKGAHWLGIYGQVLPDGSFHLDYFTLTFSAAEYLNQTVAYPGDTVAISGDGRVLYGRMADDDANSSPADPSVQRLLGQEVSFWAAQAKN